MNINYCKKYTHRWQWTAMSITNCTFKKLLQNNDNNYWEQKKQQLIKLKAMVWKSKL